MTDDLEPIDVTPLVRHTPEVRRKMLKFCVKLREVGTVKAACEHVGWSKNTAYNHKKRDEDFARRWDDAAYYHAGAIREALTEKALKDRNPHALIHLDRLHNREDYVVEQEERQQAPTGLTVIINVPRPLSPDAIPEGDPEHIIDILPRAHTLSIPSYLPDDEDEDDE